MRWNVLGESCERCRKKLLWQTAACVAAIVATLGLNLCLLAWRTPRTHHVFLVTNIVTDVLCGWFLLYFLSIRVIPRWRLYRLACRQSTSMEGVVEQISLQTVRYMHMDCRRITAGGHSFFLPEKTIVLEVGTRYTFRLAANTVVEVSQ